MVFIHRAVDTHDVPLPGMGERAENERTRLIRAHGVRDGIALAQGIKNEAGHPGAILGACVAGPLAPVARGRLDRLVPVENVRQHINRCCNSSAVAHG